ncbi:MAG: DNA polymerase/3'-5' exonuclease PolX [Planctomycetia bacterium]|nr:DNA polymerase/3'-5' exonuclease PolX [Planctomycetia bacterium]
MTNADIAAIFTQIADILEYQGEGIFRVRAYRTAAHAIGSMVESLADIQADVNRFLTDIEGIGTDLAAKIKVLLATGTLPLLEELQAAVPAYVFELMRVPGLGPKKVKLLVEELGVASLDDLERACQTGKVQLLKGFGSKTQAKIVANIAFAKNPAHSRLLWSEADAIVQQLLTYLSTCSEVLQISGAGSWRRGQETVGDIDILVDSNNAQTVMNHLHSWPETTSVLLSGDTKTSVRGPRGMQIDLRVVKTESFGAAMQYFTGSKEHNVRLRSRAREYGLTINEYGVYRLTNHEDGESSEVAIDPSKNCSLAGRTEADLYAAVGLPWIPPELREGRGEILLAHNGQLPHLVELADICGDLHMHTTATDGENTLEEMLRCARQRGLNYIAITDHGQRVTMAHGLNAQRLLDQWGEIDRLNESLAVENDSPLVILKGIEVDMLEKGGLDLPDEVLEQADWVVASLHYGQSQPRQQITARIIEAIENRFVSVIGHPTGRLINRRPAYDVDIEAVIEAAARTGTFLEINANPWRLDLNEYHAFAAKQAGVKIVISTDAHSTHGFEVMRCGILQARRAGLEAKDIVNTRSLNGLRQLLQDRPKAKA